MTNQVRVAVFTFWYAATLAPALVIALRGGMRRVSRWSYLFAAGAVSACIWILWSYQG